MKIIFNFNDNRWEHAALVDLSIKLLSKGEKVTWIDCRKYKFSLNDYRYSFFLKLFFRKDYILKIMEFISLKYKNNFDYIQLKYIKSSNIKHVPLDYSSIYNEVISITRDSDPSNIKLNLFKKSLKNVYSNIFQDLLSILKKYNNKDCTVYIFNGRFLKEQAADNLCKLLKIKVKYVERFSPQWSDRYFIFNQKIHLSKYRANLIEKHYKKSINPRKNEIAKNWFDDRISGISQNFTKPQKMNFHNITSELPLICFFHSSEDELVLSDLGSDNWKNQFEVVKFLFQNFNKSDSQLIIRVHPNLKNKSLAEKWRWKILPRQLKASNFRIINYADETNSYSLIKSSNVVITYGSTIGVEAAYLGKRSILLGKALHDELDVVHTMVSKNKLRDELEKIRPRKYLKQNYLQALKYGYFMETAGIKISKLKTFDSKYTQDPIFIYKKILLEDSHIIKIIKNIESKFSKFIFNITDLISIIFSNIFKY